MIFPITYLGPVHYYARLLHARQVQLEHCCRYERQTFRNRCVIVAANGQLPLTIPVVKQSGVTPLTRDVRIAYDTPWQTLHWRSLVSAYQSSPYFEYYMDDFEPFYTRRFEFLFDFDLQLTELVCRCIDMPFHYTFTTGYETAVSEAPDLRHIIHPKNDGAQPDALFHPQPYRQLFQAKIGFLPNLSIVDLLFNKGPESYLVLRDSMGQP